MANAQASPRKMPKLDPAADTNGSKSQDGQDILEQIDAIQSQLDSLNDCASDEILKVEQKFNQMRKPHYKKRGELIGKIPDFWLNTFINHPQIAALLDETDEEVLRYMEQLIVEETEDIRSGYTIIFQFKTNPFFENTELKKEFTMSESGEMGTTETKINWKQGMALTEKSGDKGKSKVGGKRERPGDDPPSFFSWFEDNSMGGDEVGEVIKDDIWANPMQYYLDLDEDEDEGDEAYDDIEQTEQDDELPEEEEDAQEGEAEEE